MLHAARFAEFRHHDLCLHHMVKEVLGLGNPGACGVLSWLTAACSAHLAPALSWRAHPSTVLAAGGETGDLYVFVSVREHPELRREGVTVHSDVGISYLEAILGEGRW